MITINNLYLFFIFSGVIIILTLLYIRYLTKEAFKTILEFFDANEKSEYDLHKFLPEVIRLLKRTKVEDVFYRIVYLNSIIEREKQARKEGIQKRFVRADYSIYVGIVPGLYRGERRYIYRLILEILFLIVEMDILIKIKSVNEAFYDFSRLQTFILHDAKNLTQFIQTLSSLIPSEHFEYTIPPIIYHHFLQTGHHPVW